jgi:tetratricopeptide (TPR) repeat protein
MMLALVLPDESSTVASGRDADAGAIPRGAVIGRYTVLSLVGRGGMGEVYAAYDPELDRKIALKLLRPNGARDESRGHVRLLREAKAMARISSRNVVSVHDAGTSGERVFVAMEFVEGANLRDWLDARPRTQDEILAVFLEAARGLVAAHEAGLVHRDFKPSNVMVARDGSVRVSDFGLARGLQGWQPAPEPGLAASVDAVPLDATLTATGRLLGTPRYMAPEQLKGGAVDARTDQFSFCVALYEALYDQGPFGPGGLAAHAAAGLMGRVLPAAPKSAVPARVRGALVRGLALDPQARWPSMRELISALAPEASKARRRWAAAGGVALLASLVVIFLARRPDHSASLCHAGPARIAGAWETAATGPRPRREAIQRAFLGSGAPDASEVWARVPALLDRYVATWLTMYEDACLATHARGKQSEADLDLRMSCLEERRIAVVALTDVFASADRDVVGKGVDAVNALPDLARCGDVAALRTPVEPPRDATTAAAVADLRRRIATVKALKDTGRTNEWMAQEARLVRDARDTGYRPVLAEALSLSSILVVGIEGPRLTPRLEEAVSTALSVGRDDLAAMAAISRVAAIFHFQPDLEGAPFWVGLARALLTRAGPGQDRLRGWLSQNEALLAARRNDLPAALELARAATALKKRALPAGHPDIAISVDAEAEFLRLMGRNGEALRLNDGVLAMYTAAYGPGSLSGAYALNNRGYYLNDLGRPAEALAALRDAMSAWVAHLGANHPTLAYPLTGMGVALVKLGRATEALPPLERALRLRDPKATDPADIADTQFAIAQALVVEHADSDRARTLAADARKTYLRLGLRQRAEQIDAWSAGLQSPRHAR